MSAGALETYSKHVEMLEGALAPYAKRSFEAENQVFVDGAPLHKYFADLWKKNPERLSSRTPLQLERDRILYSSPMRKETEKYHVLYNGQRRIVRNYATHSMRMTQVTRSICRALRLNTDFAEAIAMGSKVGAVPFIHAAKEELGRWARKKIEQIDNQFAEHDPLSKPKHPQPVMGFGETTIPEWLSQLRSERIRERVTRFIPWAAGKDTNSLYSSGQESYWLLSTNAYTVESLPRRFSPETMFGIWRHTRGLLPGPDTFHHKMKLYQGTSADRLEVHHEITSEHFTYEALVVQYADDITWAIENLNDANSAALLNGKASIYSRLKDHLRTADGLPDGLLPALDTNSAGGLYTYFIDDFIKTSREALGDVIKEGSGRARLISGDRQALIGLSAEAQTVLNRMCKFLNDVVFAEPRVSNRKEMLMRVAVACAELLYSGGSEALPRVVDERKVLGQWNDDQLKLAKELLDDPIHKVQLSLDVLAEMGDQEIYDFVGIESL